MLTMQEIFDKSVSGVIKQGHPARHSEHGRCSYRTEAYGEQLKCAVGQLIPDELYDPSLEGRGVDQYLLTADFARDAQLRMTLEKAGVPLTVDAFTLLNDLQHAHDETHPVDFMTTFKLKAREIAARWGLDPKEAQ